MENIHQWHGLHRLEVTSRVYTLGHIKSIMINSTYRFEQNYRHCFQDGGGVLSGNVPYQIFNRSGVSSLAWQGHNGIYVFSATVVANNYRLVLFSCCFDSLNYNLFFYAAFVIWLPHLLLKCMVQLVILILVIFFWFSLAVWAWQFWLLHSFIIVIYWSL